MIPQVLRNLSELDIENLQCGRITAQTMHEAAKRLTKYNKGFLIGGGELYKTKERELADELNDMLEAARKMREANSGWVGITDDEMRNRVANWEHQLEMNMRVVNADFPTRENEQFQDKPFQAGGTGF